MIDQRSSFGSLFCVLSRESMTRARRAALPGFSLVEVLLAMGIFAIGFVAIASVFPAGALLQRNAADASLARNLARNAEALVKSTTLTYTDGDASTDLDSIDGSSFVQGVPNSVFGKWGLDARSYPSYIAGFEERDFYWVPLVHLTNTATPTAENWRVYLFVLNRDNSADYTTNTATYPAAGFRGDTPGLRFVQCTRNDAVSFTTPDLTDELAIADWILASDGNVYKITAITTNSITINGFINANWGSTADWGIYYAPPGTGEDTSPTLRIVGPLANLVTDPSAP